MIMDASPAPVATAPDGYGAQTTSPWLENLPEDAFFERPAPGGLERIPLREHPKLRQFRSTADLARSYLEAQRLIGRKAVGLMPPDPDAPDADKAAFERELRAMLGVPPDPDGYDIALPEGTEPDPRLMPWFRKAAHDMGLSPAQAQGLVEGYQRLVAEMTEEAGIQARSADGERKAQALRVLRTLWGERLPERAENARRGFMAVAEQAGIAEPEAMAFLERHGDDPLVLRVFNLVGNAFREDGLVTGAAAPAAPGPMSMEDFYRTEVFRNR